MGGIRGDGGTSLLKLLLRSGRRRALPWYSLLRSSSGEICLDDESKEERVGVGVVEPWAGECVRLEKV